MAVNDLGQVIAGAWGPGNIPNELLKYDKDKAGLLLFLERGTSRMMHMIHERFGKRDVTSFRPTWFDVNQLDDVFNALETQTQTTFKQIKMTNDQAIQLQPGDLLAVDGLFCADGAAGGTAGTYSRVWSTTHRMEEMILVEREPIKDSAGAGYAYVHVRRGYINNYTTGRINAEPAAAASADGYLQENDRLLKMANTQWTGSDAPRGVSKNIEVDSNPLQIMRFAFEEQVEASKEQTFQKESHMNISQKLALKRMAYEMEYRALYGTPIIEQEGNSHRYATGGLFHYIQNVVDYSAGGTVTSMDWMAFQRNTMAPLFELGGSGSKVAFCSISQFTNLASLLWNKVTISINEGWSKAFKFEIYKIAGGGGELNIVPSWVYGRNKFRANQMLVLDFGGPYFKVDVMEDIHINKGPNGAGLQLPGQRIKKYEYVGITGLQRRARQYHAIVTGLPALA